MIELKNLTWTQKDEQIFSLLDETRDPVPGVPSPLGVAALIGPTQWGKTRLVSSWANRHHEKVVIWNPQTDTPEDIGGFPYKDKGNLLWTQPGMIPPDIMRLDGGWVLLIDELDKAQEDVLSCALSLLSERRIRGSSVRPSAIVVAMNPPKRPLPDPLMARLVFVPYPPDKYNVFERADLKEVTTILSDVLHTPEPMLPELPTTAGGAHRLKAWMQRDVFWRDTVVQSLVIEGTFASQHAQAIVARLRDDNRLSAMEWVKAADASELATGLMDVLYAVRNGAMTDGHGLVNTEDADFKHVDADELMHILQGRMKDDETGEIGRVMDAFFNSPAAIAGVELGSTPAMLAAGKQTMMRKWTRSAKEDVLGNARAEL
jgi:hypothetical protein